jgi:hypothetical protein
MTLLLKFAPWIAAVLVVFGAGIWTGHALNPWHGRYTSLQAADAIDRVHGEEAVRQALTAQLAQAQATTRNNQDSMVHLANQNAQIAADRNVTLARVRRLEQLLSAASAPRSPASGSVPQSNRGSDPPGTRGEGSLTEVERLLVDAREESERNANRLDALIAQVKPQVQ